MGIGFLDIVVWSILIVILSISIWRKKWERPVFQYLFLCRVPIICGLLLATLPLIGHFMVPVLLGNLLILPHSAGALAVASISLIAANMVVQTTYFIVQQAPHRMRIKELRFGKYFKWLCNLSGVQELWLRWLAALLLALPLNVGICLLSLPELEKNKLTFVGMAALGLLFGLGLLYVSNLIFPGSVEHQAPGFKDNGGIDGSIQDPRNLSKRARIFKGYLPADADYKREIGRRYWQMTWSAISLIALFFLGAIAFQPGNVPLPALFFVVYLILVNGYIFAALTFFLDRFRVPLLIFVIWISVLLSSVVDTRHYYLLQPMKDLAYTSTAGSGAKNSSEVKQGKMESAAVQERKSSPKLEHSNTALLDALKSRLATKADERTLVAFAVVGGGIQAAAWTAQVLTGLHEHDDFGPKFIDATGLISSVSGGSVGSLFFLDRLPELNNLNGQLDLTARQKIYASIRESAMGNSLPDVAWSLAYQDSLRLFGLNLLVADKGGRSWALQESFRLRLRNQKATVRGTWRNDVSAGKMPLLVFNATLVESGDRLLISPFEHFKADRAQSFAGIYPDFDLNVATAARLSATFPYVSSLASPKVEDGSKVWPGWHVADGGYFDTYGMFTLIEWLNAVVRPNAQALKLKRVIVIQINAFPEQTEGEDQLSAWQAAVYGPVQALINVRISTQNARNKAELGLLREILKASGVSLCQFNIRYQPPKDENDASKKNLLPPLSWKLTRSEKDRIADAWENWLRLEKEQGRKLALSWEDNCECESCSHPVFPTADEL